MSENANGAGVEVTKGLGKELGFAALIISILNFALLVGMYYSFKAPGHGAAPQVVTIEAEGEAVDLGPLQEALAGLEAGVDARMNALETAVAARIESAELKADEAAALAGRAAGVYVATSLGELDAKLIQMAEQAQTEQQIETILKAKQLVQDVKLSFGVTE